MAIKFTAWLRSSRSAFLDAFSGLSAFDIRSTTLELSVGDSKGDAIPAEGVTKGLDFITFSGEYTLLGVFGPGLGEDKTGCKRKPGEYSGAKAVAACKAKETRPGLGVSSGRALECWT